METVCLQIPHRKGLIPGPIIFIGMYVPMVSAYPGSY